MEQPWNGAAGAQRQRELRDLEQKHVDDSIQRILDLLEMFVPGLQLARRVMAVANSDLISGILAGKISSAKIAKNDKRAVTEQVLNLRTNMRQAIEHTSGAVGYYEYWDLEQTVSQLSSVHQRQRGQELLGAEKAMRVAIADVAFTMDVFQRANQRLVDRADHPDAASPQAQKDLLLANAVLVFELCDFVAHFLEEFAVDGLPRLKQMYAEMQASITQKKARVASDRRRIETEDMDDALRLQFLAECDDSWRALERCQAVWDEYLAEKEEVAGALAKDLSRVLPLVRLRRDLAYTRLQVFEVTDLTSVLSSGAQEMQRITIDIARLPLVTLSMERLSMMIGFW